MFGVTKHIVDGADSTERAGGIVLESVHDQRGCGCNTPCTCIAGAIAKNRDGNVRSVPAVAVCRGGVKAELGVRGCHTPCQIRMVLVKARIGNSDHFTRPIERKGSVVGNVLNPSN